MYSDSAAFFSRHLEKVQVEIEIELQYRYLYCVRAVQSIELLMMLPRIEREIEAT